MWPALLGTLAGLVLALGLIHFTALGLGALVVAPLLAGGVFNYWYWVGYGARFLGSTWPRFLFQRQP